METYKSLKDCRSYLNRAGYLKSLEMKVDFYKIFWKIKKFLCFYKYWKKELNVYIVRGSIKTIIVKKLLENCLEFCAKDKLRNNCLISTLATKMW